MGSEVDQVNGILEATVGHAHSAGYAAITKQIALDEPLQLESLSGVLSASGAAQSAVTALQAVCGNVPTDLQSIVDDPSPRDVQVQVNSINQVRCCQVLPSVDLLWPAAALAVSDADANDIQPANGPCAYGVISCA